MLTSLLCSLQKKEFKSRLGLVILEEQIILLCSFLASGEFIPLLNILAFFLNEILCLCD